MIAHSTRRLVSTSSCPRNLFLTSNHHLHPLGTASGLSTSIINQHRITPPVQGSYPSSHSLNGTKRLFHATPQREILPLLAGAAVLLVGRYSWKALNRMDTEWDDYLWELKRYERDRLRNADNGVSTTIGVDLGTIYLKLSRMNKNRPELIETTQGDRYRFNGILLQQEGGGGATDDVDDHHGVVTGRAALDKFYYPRQDSSSSSSYDDDSTTTGNVTLPYMQLQQESHSNVAGLVQKVFLPAVREAMDRVTSDNSTDATKEKNTLRTVLTLPPTFYNQHGETIFRNFHDKTHHTVTVPDPVAAIWGAQVLNLIPTPQSKEENDSSATLVIDVGGLASTISIVRDDKVISSVTLDDVGGESFVRRLVDRIIKEADDDNLARDPMALTLIQSNARSSVLELVNKTQTQVHIPFLFMGRRKDSPHLDTAISRIALEQAVQDYWNTNVVPTFVQQKMVLSSSLPPPVGATSLFTSAITRVLEDANEIPTNMKHILLVGGGSRLKLFEDSCRESLLALMGPQLLMSSSSSSSSSSDKNKLVIPETSLRAELTALGAASLLPNFDYDYGKGLERTSQ